MSDDLVMHVVTRLNIGGLSRHVINLSAALPRFGFRSTIVSGSETSAEGELRPTEGPYIQIGSLGRSIHPLRDVKALRALTRVMETERPTIVHTNMAKAGLLGRVAAKRAGVPIVIHSYHGHVLSGYFSSVANVLFTMAERALARRTDALVAVSEEVRRDLETRGIGSPSQWNVIPVVLDLDSLAEGSLPPSEARSRLGLPSARHAVGIVGRLVPIKDVATFLRVGERLCAELDDIVLVVAGDGELRAELESQARRTMGDKVRFLGWVSDLPTLYAALDVVLLTSRNEGTPVTLIEAAAAGKPVVAADVGGVSAVVTDSVTGYLTTAGDDATFASKTMELLSDPSLAQRMGEQARARVLDRFSSEGIASKLADLYRRLIDE
ncbi:MAG: glycosyltransferase family 4 protein [Actinomycetota bacterium]